MIAQSSSGGSPFALLIFAVPLLLLFFMSRNQKRRVAEQQARQHSAQVGDEIMTTGGIFGTIVDEDEVDDTVIVEIAPGTRIKLLRAGISRTLSDEDAYEDDDDEGGEDRADDENAQGPIGS